MDLQRILCIGGGPAGLYFALLMKARNPALDITVVERNRPFDTFGWGVVLSDQTLANLAAADGETAALIGNEFHHWDDIQVFFKGRQVRSGGHGFCGIGRKRLLNILQERCLALGVKLVFETDATDDQAIAAQYNADLVIASDGLNSRIRQRYADVFKPDIDLRNCRFVWLGTHQTFDAFTFAFEQTEHGWFQAHAYQFDDKTSTFIVETPEAVWKAHGLDQMEQPEAIAFCEKLFAKYLGGHPLISNATHLRGSANWIRFPRVVCERWTHRIDVQGRSVPVVLMGDAAHTAHFSIGSGTKLALEDAIDLANEFEQRRHCRPRARRLRGTPQRRGAQDPERGAQLHRMVRKRAALHRHADRAVCLFVAHALAAHQPREPARARHRMARRLRALACGRQAGGAHADAAYRARPRR